MDKFEELIKAVKASSNEQKQRLFSEIRESIQIHNLEKSFNIKAEVILEAIGRATDLTQRGIRGVIAETIFVLDVIPQLKDWQNDMPEGNHSYDVCLRKQERRVRIQVKMQRKERGQPKIMRDGSYVVEVQRTRTGEKEGAKTRPYRFSDFDLIAVCMEPSTKKWNSFMYAPAASLQVDMRDKNIIKTFQAVPSYSNKDQGIWTSNLETALEKIA